MRFTKVILVGFCLLLVSAAAFGQLEPTLEWSWTESDILPDWDNVDVVPLVINLTDDNLDGRIDDNDFPDIVFSSYAVETGPAVVRAVNGWDGSSIFDVEYWEWWVQQGSNLAAGDIDLDGKVEIIGHKRQGRKLIAFENDGSHKWTTNDDFSPGSNWGGPAIADMDQDGIPEVIMGRTVFDASGSRLWDGLYGGGRNGYWGPLSCVANLDMSGSLELVAGNCVYHSDGSIYWQRADSFGPNFVEPWTRDGFPAVANLDTDPFPEVVFVTRGVFYILEHDGTLKVGPISIPGSDSSKERPGGPPTIHDYDSDGQPEIGITGTYYYTVFESDGTILWSNPVNVNASTTASTVFDLDGDGVPEAIYFDGDSIRIVEALNGTVLWAGENAKKSGLDLPVVADIDRDGHAEVVVVGSYDRWAPKEYTGLSVFGLDTGVCPWVGARRIWNQHTYHITNINEDGAVPQFEENSWQAHNTYRCQEPFVVARDGGMLSLDAPSDTVFVDSNYAVMATVVNMSNVCLTFNVVATIDEYGDTVQVSGLAPDSSIQVTFKDWLVPSADSATYTMTVCTRVVNDADSTNDCAQKSIFAYNPVGMEEQGSRLNVEGLTFQLLQNEPNPFGGRTVIGYSLPAAGAVALEVYDITGRLIKTLVDGHHEPGLYQVRWDTKNQASGIYFCRLNVGGFTDTKKMVLLR